MTKKCIKAWVSGRVQGVFFRESTKRLAQQLGITGHAINLPDGRVEVLACGDSQQLELLIEWLHKGPEYAQVEALESHDVELQQPTSFITG